MRLIDTVGNEDIRNEISVNGHKNVKEKGIDVLWKLGTTNNQ